MMIQARGPELALKVTGALEKYKAPLSQEQIAGVIQQEVFKGGYTDNDLMEAIGIIQEFIASEGGN